MTQEGSNYDTSDFLNSSFYSSNSINALEHSRTFRNSLILKEMSDNSISLSSSSIQNIKDLNNDKTIQTDANSNTEQKEQGTTNQRGALRKDEVQTVNMTTSPSLSALADILDKKSKRADKKQRASRLIEVPVIEEDTQEEEFETEQSDDLNNNMQAKNWNEPLPAYESPKVHIVASPNLIDLNNSPTPMKFKKNTQFSSVEQPDFLTTPKVEQGSQLRQTANYTLSDDLPHIEEQETPSTNFEQEHSIIEEPKNVEQEQPDKIIQSPQNYYVHERVFHKTTIQPKEREQSLNVKKTRAPKLQPRKVSMHDNNTQTSQKKKKGIFSFLKRKNSRAVSENLDIKEKSDPMVNSASHSQLTNKKNNSIQTVHLTTEKLSKKSHSSSSIFNTLRRKSVTTGTVITPNDVNDQNTINTIDSEATKITTAPPIHIASPQSNPVPAITRDIGKRNPTPLNFDIILDSIDYEQEQEVLQQPSILNEEPNRRERSEKRDSGEVFFPKSLDADEIDSIVKIERNRSQKSNNTKRRSVDRLSINAQSEGMVIMEASRIVLSTPDLSKSPTSSILKSGRFDFMDDFSGENTSIDNIRNDNNADQEFSLASVEEKLNQLTTEYEKEHRNIDKIQKNITSDNLPKQIEDDKLEIGDDPELMTDIMEFADLINFGDGIDLDSALNNATDTQVQPTLEPGYNTSMDINIDNSRDNNSLELSPVKDYDEFITSEQDDMYTDDNAEDNVNNVHEYFDKDADFEHEDFNELEEDEGYINRISPKLNHNFIDPSNAKDRPISMSFRGLTAPSFNASEVIEPTIDENIVATDDDAQNCVKFSSKIILYETYGEFEYDRHPDIGTCNQLTPQLAQMIKAELNELKTTMEVHKDSTCYTQFF